jgi:hypothetical protein
MKKILVAVSFFFVFAFTFCAVAELQTVLVSGSLRTRGYYVDNITDLNDDGGGPVTTVGDDGTVTTSYVQNDDQNFIENLVDLYVNATLTDSVYVRINPEAYGTFGQDDTWDVYMQEAWVKLTSIAGTPWSATLGSFYIDLGRGFLFSKTDKYWLFDGLMAEGDYNPIMVKAGFIRRDDEGKNDRDIYWADVDYAPAERAFSLGGTVATQLDGPTDYQPTILGARAAFKATDAINLFGDFVYEMGDAAGDLDKKAWAAEVGGSYKTDFLWTPTIRAMYTYASGDDDATDDEDANYDPWFNYTYYGYAFSPALTNIQIINLGLDLQPTEFTKLFADYYYYLQNEEAAMVMGNLNLDSPGVTAMTNGTDDSLGSEVDLGVKHTYTDSVTTSLIFSAFFPGDAYGDVDDALEIRGEILVSF